MKDALAEILSETDESEIIDLVSQLVAIPSYSEAPGAESALAQFIADFFKKAGIGSFVGEAAPGRPNVFARLPGKGGGKSLVLCGHLDTLSPDAMPDPFTARLHEGRIYGLGVADMKAALACMMLAMRSIKTSGIALAGDLMFAGLCDEQSRSLGASSLARSASGQSLADGAIFGEPTDLSICVGHRGLEWFVIELKGKNKGDKREDHSVNAVSAAARLITRLDAKLRPRLSSRKDGRVGASSINIGRIEGGKQPSDVPDECRVFVDRRWLPSENYDAMVGEIESVVKEIEESTPGLCASLRVMEENHMEGGMVHAPFETDISHPLVRSCLSSLGFVLPKLPQKHAIATFPAWCDAGVLANYAGTPSVIWGPGSLETAHTDHESVDMAQLLPAVGGYALTARSFCA